MRGLKTLNRVAILKQKLGITWEVFAERCGLSAVYLRKLAGGQEMSRKAAVALSAATGVSIKWINGSIKRNPILTNLGEVWNPEMFKKNRWRRHQKEESEMDAKLCARWHVMFSDVMAKILFAAFKKNKLGLACALISESQHELTRRFKAHGLWPRNPKDQDIFTFLRFFSRDIPDLPDVAKLVVERLERNLKDELQQCGPVSPAALSRAGSRSPVAPAVP